MLRGALLGLLVVSAVTDATAQERASEQAADPARAPVRGATTERSKSEGNLPPGSPSFSAASATAPAPKAEQGALNDEPPPSSYDRARQDGGQTPDTSSLVGQLVKTMVALAFVCGIIWVVFKFGAARLLPGAMGPRDGRLVRVVERVLVDQKSSLLIVDVGPDRMLLGCAEGGISLITKLGAAEPPTQTTRGKPAWLGGKLAAEPRNAPSGQRDTKPPGFRAVLDAFSPKKTPEDDNGTT